MANPASIRRAAALASDMNVLRTYGITPQNMWRAISYLRAGYSHAEAARRALQH